MNKKKKPTAGFFFFVKFQFVELLFRCAVGADIIRPPNICSANIEISEGNNRYMPYGMSFCLQNDRAAGCRPYNDAVQPLDKLKYVEWAGMNRKMNIGIFLEI